MDIAFILKSKRFWTIILSPVITWVLMKWPLAVNVAVFACTQVTSVDTGGEIHTCTPAEAQAFALTTVPFVAVSLVALLFKHRQLTLSPKKPADSVESGDQGGMPITPKG